MSLSSYQISSYKSVSKKSEHDAHRNGDEPEPIDLTHLNVEASMMCLASKVGTLVVVVFVVVVVVV